MYVNGFLCAAGLDKNIIGNHTYLDYKNLSSSLNSVEAEPYVKNIVALLNNTLTRFKYGDIRSGDPLVVKLHQGQANALAIRFDFLESKILSFDQKFRLSQAVVTWLYAFNSNHEYKGQVFNENMSILKDNKRTDIAMANAMLTENLDLRIDKLKQILETIGSKSNNFQLAPEDLVTIKFMKERLNLFSAVTGPRDVNQFSNYMSHINPMYPLLFDLHGCKKHADIYKVIISLHDGVKLEIPDIVLPFSV